MKEDVKGPKSRETKQDLNDSKTVRQISAPIQLILDPTLDSATSAVSWNSCRFTGEMFNFLHNDWLVALKL